MCVSERRSLAGGTAAGGPGEYRAVVGGRQIEAKSERKTERVRVGAEEQPRKRGEQAEREQAELTSGLLSLSI